jgi:hypothetical protein
VWVSLSVVVVKPSEVLAARQLLYFITGGGTVASGFSSLGDSIISNRVRERTTPGVLSYDIHQSFSSLSSVSGYYLLHN